MGGQSAFGVMPHGGLFEVDVIQTGGVFLNPGQLGWFQMPLQKQEPFLGGAVVADFFHQ